MLDADGAGAGAPTTNWSATSVIDMWLAISNQTTENHWTLLAGWRRSYELTLQHISAVRSYRENLMNAWPPSRSPAAAAYIARLDNLIEHLYQTYDAASANHSAFHGATLALTAARRDLEVVVNEYIANDAKLAAQESPEPRRALPIRGAVIAQPPVPNGRQAELEAQARRIMNGLSAELATARADLRQPPKYDPYLRSGEIGSAGNDDFVSPPTVPAIKPFDPRTRAAHLESTPTLGPEHELSSGSIAPSQPGLVLGGHYPPAQTSQPMPPGLPSTPSANPAFTPGQHPMPPATVIGQPPAWAGPSGAIKQEQSRQIGGGRALPPGGIIGASPATGLNQPSTGRPPSVVNPIGGMISPSRATAPVGDPHATKSAPTLPYQQAPPRSSDDKSTIRGRRWDPTDPWKVAQGNDPVIMAKPERPIDPGPAIGLD